MICQLVPFYLFVAAAQAGKSLLAVISETNVQLSRPAGPKQPPGIMSIVLSNCERYVLIGDTCPNRPLPKQFPHRQTRLRIGQRESRLLSHLIIQCRRNVRIRHLGMINCQLIQPFPKI